MRSNYKRLGAYIQQINIKNSSLEVSNLLGVSIAKKFMPSIANTIGTDMSKYKIIKRHQFAYGPVTSRNGDKISIALLEDEEAIISVAYTVFEVIDSEELDPEYLMMWFRRPEFDRYARYKSHGSARETFDWEEMCEVELPIPDIEKQREIVREYNTVVDRIKLNEELSQKLEETAQAIYRQWFEEFEFPWEPPSPLKGEIDAPKVLNSANCKMYPKLHEKALEMRKYPTNAEAILWEELRAKKLGVKFRQQHIIDCFIVDFYCVEKGLVIEVDGEIHDLQKERDEEREHVLRSLGCEILRFKNEEIFSDLQSVLKKIELKLSEKSPSGDLGVKKGYKSSGGEMVWCEELEKDIPKEWEVGTLELLGDVVGGATPSKDNKKYWADRETGIAWLSPKDLTKNNYKFISSGENFISNLGYKKASTKLMPKGSVLFSSRAPIGILAITTAELCTNQGFKSIVPKEHVEQFFVYYYLKNQTVDISNQGTGSTFDEVSGTIMKNYPVFLPHSNQLSSFNKIMKRVFEIQHNHEKEVIGLKKLQNLLLSKMAA